MFRKYLELIRFDKPIGTLLLLWPTLGALVVAANGTPPLYTIVVFSLGVFLSRSAGCAINDAFDANFDKFVKRTKDRPLARGDLKRIHAVLICLLFSVAAFTLAYFYLKKTTICLSIIAFLIYISYPYMKRIFALPQAYMGVAFSFGILMAFVEIKGRVDYIAWILFTANLFHAFGYDTVYALVDIDDDLKIGIKTTAITCGKWVVPFISVCYVFYFMLFFALGFILDLGVVYYLSLSVAGALLAYQIAVLIKEHKERYFSLFLLNNWVCICVFIGLTIGLLIKRYGYIS